jgi:hypothetical protein
MIDLPKLALQNLRIPLFTNHGSVPVIGRERNIGLETLGDMQPTDVAPR